MVTTNFKKLPWRSKKYIEHVKGLPCCLSGDESTDYLAIDPHHENLKGHGGKSTKCGDERQLPIRHDLHVEMESGNSSRASVYARFGKDPEQMIQQTQAKWEQVHNSRPWEAA